MELQANVAFLRGHFIATLSDGRQIEQAGLETIADSLHRAGVMARAVSYEWRAGLHMITAGQQVALRAAIRAHEAEAQSIIDPVAA